MDYDIWQIHFFLKIVINDPLTLLQLHQQVKSFTYPVKYLNIMPFLAHMLLNYLLMQNSEHHHPFLKWKLEALILFTADHHQPGTAVETIQIRVIKTNKITKECLTRAHLWQKFKSIFALVPGQGHYFCFAPVHQKEWKYVTLVFTNRYEW